MKKAKVLFLSLSAQDNQAAGGRTRVVSEIRYAIGDRYDVTLLCLVQLRKLLQPIKLRRARKALREDSGARVIYLPKWPSLGLRLLEPLARWLNQAYVAVVILLLRPAILHSHGVGASSLALGVKRLFGRLQVVADLHGVDSAEYQQRKGLSTLDAAGRQLVQRELAVIRGSDALMIVSEALRTHYATAHGEALTHATLLPCLTRRPVTLDRQRTQAQREALGLSDKLVFLYLGSYRAYQMVEETIAAFKAICERVPDAFFLILTGHRPEFEAALRRHDVPADRYRIETVQQADVHAWIQLADVGFMLRSDELVNRVASPTKFAEYLINGVPVITTPHVGDYSALVEEHGLGYQLADAAVEPALFDFLGTVRAERDVVRQRCHAYARDALTWEQAGHRLPDAYDALIASSRA